MSDSNSARPPTKVWTTLITNTEYLSVPFGGVVHRHLPGRRPQGPGRPGILKQRVAYLLPSTPKAFTNDPRFYDCWSKLTPFSLVEYERVVQLDSDMLVLQNMDELMELDLDPPSQNGEGNRVFACSHACACNPLKKPHYPENWIPKNCAYTTQHSNPEAAQTTGAPSDTALGIPNGGLQVVNPSKGVYDKIIAQLAKADTSSYDFADQSLLGDLFHGRWVGLPYIYNALKTLRWEGVHDAIWRDDRVKNSQALGRVGQGSGCWGAPEETKDPAHKWWHSVNEERLEAEERAGLRDGF
ncbi:hypothetical protein N7468_009042 [Penicillium chermesinum]|uniref:Glycosyl transferase family protein n=1 Tax=Penicillium chermesinum TaxID=63820 RepID=A0A9W9NHG1_9EURO|nr:uncharacterized protein N7468_009042 [Penicillium chermesinum]KAJ5219838.1 hypothetical protein N7468_009042 [Penicillium chermesinum]